MSIVSVVVPTFNRAELVSRAVRSAFAQSYPDLEVIVVDDGSTDDTERVVRATDERVRYLRTEHTGLPAVARNRGIAIASGDYIAFLDSDDEWLPQKLERQVRQLEANPRAGLACSNAMIAGSDRLYLHRGQGCSGRVWRALLRENFVVASTTVVRRAELDVCGGFCESPILRAVEDYDLWLRIAAISEIVFDPGALAVYTSVGTSLRSAVTTMEHELAIKRVLERAAEFASLHPSRGVTERAALQELRNRFRPRQTAMQEARRALARSRRRIALSRRKG